MNSRVSPENGASSSLLCGGFEAAHDSRADCDDSSSSRARALDCRTHLGAHGDTLGMHSMLGEIVDTHRLERPGSDVQRHERGVDAHLAATREHRFIEVQTCGGSGDCAGLACVDSLISSRVVRFCRPLDVWRQWH